VFADLVRGVLVAYIQVLLFIEREYDNCLQLYSSLFTIATSVDTVFKAVVSGDAFSKSSAHL